MTKDYGPGVRLPPPLGIVLIAASAELMHRFVWSLTVDFYNVALASLFALLATALSAVAFFTFRHFKTNIMPFQPDQHLMTSGIFAYSRNPIYLSFLLYQVMLAFALHNLWMLLFLPISYGFLRYYVIAKEERYLSRLFAAPYKAYLTTTRRWC